MIGHQTSKWPQTGAASRAWRMAILAALAVALLAGTSSCSKATKPKEVKYNIYLGLGNTIYIYDADSLILLDSIIREHRAEELAASPDGRSLYVIDRESTYSYPTLWKIDIQTKQVVWSRSNQDVGGQRQRIRLLAGGGLVFMGNGVLRPDDGALLRRFGDSLLTMYGPGTGSRVAAFQDSAVTIIDAATGESSGRFVPRLSNGLVLVPFYIRLHPDGRRVLFIGLYGSFYYSWLLVGDVVTGQALLEYPLYQPWGEVAISDNGSVAVVTDPPEMLGLEKSLSVIDLDHLTVVGKFTNELAIQSQVHFLPDNRHALLAGPAGGYSLYPLRMLDVHHLTYQTIETPSLYSPVVGGLDIGPRL